MACAEDIKTNALLCKHCKTRQDDPAYSPIAENSPGSKDNPSPVELGRLDIGALFVNVAASLQAIEDLCVITFWKDSEISSSLVSSSRNFFEESEPEALDEFLTELENAGKAENDWAAIDDEDEDEDEQYSWNFYFQEEPSLARQPDQSKILEALQRSKLQAAGFDLDLLDFLIYGVERISDVTQCAHSFKDNSSDDPQKCKKCKLEIWNPSQYSEIFK